MLSGPWTDDKKKPGPHQWEATFSRTSYRVTTQAVKQLVQKKVKIYFGCLLTELKRLIKLFFKKNKKYLFFLVTVYWLS